MQDDEFADCDGCSGSSGRLRAAVGLPLAEFFGTADREAMAAAKAALVRFPVRTRMGDDYRVDIVEHHTDDSPGAYSLKLELADGPLPRQIVRRFDPAHDLVTHTFVLIKTTRRRSPGRRCN